MTPQSAIEPTTTTYPQSRRTTTTTCDRGVVLEVDASEVQQKYSLDTRSNIGAPKSIFIQSICSKKSYFVFSSKINPDLLLKRI